MINAYILARTNCRTGLDSERTWKEPRMSKQWIKVKALSRELGVTSHDIIVRCRNAGYDVQNSATRVKPDVEREIRGWFKEDQASDEAPG